MPPRLYKHHTFHLRHISFTQEVASHDTVLKRSSDPKCKNGQTSQKCTFPTDNSATLPIVLGVLIPLGAALIALIILHRRNKRKQRAEDANDKYASLDFGLGEVKRPINLKGKKWKGGDPEMMDLTEGSGSRQDRGLSMDMSSPYVLPGQMASSRNSLQDADDPYRPVAMIASNGDSSSSLAPPSRKASVATHSSEGASRNQFRPSPEPSLSPNHVQPSDQPLLLSPSSPALPAPVVTRKPVGQDSSPLNPTVVEEDEPVESPPLEIPRSPTPGTSFPERRTSLQQPAGNFDFDIAPNLFRNSPTIEVTSSEDAQAGRTESFQHHEAAMENQETLLQYGSNEGEAHPMSGETPRFSVEQWNDNYETYADVLGIVQKESSEPLPTPLPPTPMDEPSEDAVGLGVYGIEQDNRRFSSLRPLPPDDPSDNPEARANRIRSFYREYFDDNKPSGNEPDNYDGVDYYEDYGQEYLNGATFFDPETGQFIVAGSRPYAEPVTRRAMTPPPRAPPRYGPGYGPPGANYRHFSSGQYSQGGPRARGFSSTSGQNYRARGPVKRPAPPPAPLTNLPTPHLLRDDSAIFSAIDFAPPTSYKDRAAGRPSSPFADQKPYSPSVRAYTPLASSFNELPAMPSPHHLRKSGTFTALDFAPPPKLKADGASDAGSIRSGRSNMSATQLASMRAGAYRVSRIPKDMVGTQKELSQSLRPTWDQRGPTPG